jgi:catechol 2,3-dioxygenase
VTAIDPAARMGMIALTVADVARSLDYYRRAIGLIELGRSGDQVVLGVADRPLLRLTEQRGAHRWPVERVTGLYHLALLLPDRPTLGRWLRHYLSSGFPSPGQGDHFVSEALYLRDPDGHGVEVYADRPRVGWVWAGGRVRMVTDPVDVAGLLAEADRAGASWQGMPPETIVGHVHLQVGDIAGARAFYHGVLGFDVTAELPGALFVSAGGYHHHLGLNCWHSRGANAATDDDVARLGFLTIELPTEAALAALAARLDAAEIPRRPIPPAIAIDDPWRNTILLHVGAISDVAAILALASPPAPSYRTSPTRG